MTIKPLITLAIAVGFWVIFEISANYVIRRWRLIAEKEMWALAYWCVLIGCLVFCGFIPFVGPGGWEWGTFIGIAALHEFLCINHYFCWSYDSPATPSSGNGSTPSPTTSPMPRQDWRQNGTNTADNPKPSSRFQHYVKD